MSDFVVWFDGACPLCRREIALMRRLNRRRAIDFVDAAEAVAPDGAVCPFDKATRPKLQRAARRLEPGAAV